MCLCKCRFPENPDKDIRSPGAKVIGFVSQQMWGAGNWTRVPGRTVCALRGFPAPTGVLSKANPDLSCRPHIPAVLSPPTPCHPTFFPWYFSADTFSTLGCRLLRLSVTQGVSLIFSRRCSFFIFVALGMSWADLRRKAAASQASVRTTVFCHSLARLGLTPGQGHYIQHLVTSWSLSALGSLTLFQEIHSHVDEGKPHRTMRVQIPAGTAGLPHPCQALDSLTASRLDNVSMTTGASWTLRAGFEHIGNSLLVLNWTRRGSRKIVLGSCAYLLGSHKWDRHGEITLSMASITWCLESLFLMSD